MPKLSDKDFKFFKEQIQEDITVHNKKMSEVNSPEEVIAAYQGHFHKGTGSEGIDVGNALGSENMMIENYLFIFASTALPSLFFQNPRMIIKAKRSEMDFEASVLTAWANVDFDEDAKEENQLAIIDALLPYGFGCIKNGYNSRTGKTSKKSSLFTGKTNAKVDENNVEGDIEFLQFEKSIGVRQSPKFTYLDNQQPFGKGTRITFEYDRTLQQLIDSNLYELSENFISFFSAKSSDKRMVKLRLFESWMMISGKAHKLVYVEGWPEEIVFIKTAYDQLPRSLLRFNKMGDVLYNISHGTLGLAAQKELNYLNELVKHHLDNIRNQHVVNMSKLDQSGNLTFKSNKIGGIVSAKETMTQGDIFPVQSAPMDPNILANINNTRQYLQLIMSVSGGRGGGPDAKLATVERQKALGDALRSAGLQDAIRDFIVDQIKQRIKNVLRLGSPEMILQLKGENLVNPFTGAIMESGEDIEIGGKTGFSLKEIVTGDVDIDFVFDIDIASAARPDFPVVRKQIIEGATFAAQVEPKINAEGKKIDWDAILTDYFSTFDTIPDAKKYIKNMSDKEKQQFQQSLLAQAQAEQKPGSGKSTPTEAQIVASAGASNVTEPVTGV